MKPKAATGGDLILHRLWLQMRKVVEFGLYMFNKYTRIPTTFLRKVMGYAYLLFFYGDLVGYESLIKVLEKEETMKLPGDVIEIGSFVGGGTRKLAKYGLRFKKKVYAIDIFDPSADLIICEKGISMADIYSNYLQKLGLMMFEAYWFNVGRFPNVVTLCADSKKSNSLNRRSSALVSLMEIILQNT